MDLKVTLFQMFSVDTLHANHINQYHAKSMGLILELSIICKRLTYANYKYNLRYFVMLFYI